MINNINNQWIFILIQKLKRNITPVNKTIIISNIWSLKMCFKTINKI